MKQSNELRLTGFCYYSEQRTVAQKLGIDGNQ
jgi:hypothetical protein